MREGRDAKRGGGFFGIALRWETWAALFYLVLSFPIALAAWVVLVTLIAAGGGLAITVAGIPLLVLTMYLWCWYADLERLLANTLLDAGVRPLPFTGEGTGNLWQRIKVRLRNRYTWRALTFAMLVRFPAAVAGFSLVTVTLLWSLELVGTPAVVAAGGTFDFIGWKIDTWSEAAVAAPLGIALVVPSLHAIRLGGLLSAKVIRLLLQSAETPGMPMETKLDRAAKAAVQWPGVLGGKRWQAEGRALQLRIWSVHAAFYAAVMLGLSVINALTTAGTWWVLWPAWGWGIALALHTGYLLWGHLGGHLLAFAMANAGFFVIDATFAGTTWYFWPLLGWAIAVAAHVYVVFGFSRLEAEPLLEYRPAGGLSEAGEPPLPAAPFVPDQPR